MPDFTTGPSTLPDVGTLSYNGCTFSCLFETRVSGTVVKDAANRTTKYVEYVIEVDGYATMPVFDRNVENVTGTMRVLLTAQGGELHYEGRSTRIVVNAPGEVIRDVAWGPIPELIEFQPLGGGRSAKVHWKVTTRIPEVPHIGDQVLQFNNETVVTYDEAGYSTLAIRGTLEIPLTRRTQASRRVGHTVDDFREQYIGGLISTIDLTRFRIVRREFAISRDKRTMEFDIAAEELPYMGLPPSVMIARGSFNFRPARTGMGLCNWLCTLRVTYTVRKDQPRRASWLAFLALLRIRMLQSRLGNIDVDDQNPANPPGFGLVQAAASTVSPVAFATGYIGSLIARRTLQNQNPAVPNARRAWLIDFSGDEGLYLDSKTMTFSATWKLVTTFSNILVASGLWKKVRQEGGNVWAASVRDISGAYSWDRDLLDPAGDVIVDFGGG